MAKPFWSFGCFSGRLFRVYVDYNSIATEYPMIEQMRLFSEHMSGWDIPTPLRGAVSGGWDAVKTIVKEDPDKFIAVVEEKAKDYVTVDKMKEFGEGFSTGFNK